MKEQIVKRGRPVLDQGPGHLRQRQAGDVYGERFIEPQASRRQEPPHYAGDDHRPGQDESQSGYPALRKPALYTAPNWRS